MKTSKLVFLYVLISLSSCYGDLENPAFIKIVGRGGNTIGANMIINSVGEIIMVGKTTNNSVTYGTNVVTGLPYVIESGFKSPFIARLDQQGNQKDFRVFPIEEWAGFFKITIPDDKNKAVFIDLVDLNNGNYLVLGGFEDIPIEEIGENLAFSPFLLVLSADFEVISEIQLFNTDVDMDPSNGFEAYVTNSALYKHPDGSVYLFFKGINTLDYGDAKYVQHGFIKIDESGNLLWDKMLYNITKGTNNTGWEMTFDTSGNLVVCHNFSQEAGLNGATYATLYDPATLEKITEYELVNPGGGTNRGLFRKTSSGFISFYSRGRSLHFKGWNDSFSTNIQEGNVIYYPEHGDGEFARDLKESSDGGYLLLTRKYFNNRESAVVRKYNSMGEELWYYNLDGQAAKIEVLENGDILILYNPIYNNIFLKSTLIKLNPDGTL